MFFQGHADSCSCDRVPGGSSGDIPDDARLIVSDLSYRLLCMLREYRLSNLEWKQCYEFWHGESIYLFARASLECPAPEYDRANHAPGTKRLHSLLVFKSTGISARDLELTRPENISGLDKIE